MEHGGIRGGVKELALALFLSCNKEMEGKPRAYQNAETEIYCRLKATPPGSNEGRYEIGWFVGIGDRNYSAQWFCGDGRRQLVGCLGRQVRSPIKFRRIHIIYFVCLDK